MESRLKPMGVGQVIDNTFSIIRERFWPFQWAMFRAFLPSLIILVLLLVGLGASLILALENGSPLDASFWTSYARNLGPGLAFMTVLFVAFIVTMIIGSIYCTFGMTQIYKAGLHQEECSAKQSFQGIKGKRWRIFALTLLSMLVNYILRGILYLVFFGKETPFWATLLELAIFYTICFLFCLTVPVIVLEGQKLFRSLGRAYRLMAGHRWRVLGTLFVVYLLGYVLSGAFASMLMIPIGLAVAFKHLFLIVLAIIFGLVGLCLLAVMITYFYGPLTLIYYDLRIRKEGYDIQQGLAGLSEGQPAGGNVSL